jgi:hypothetical protein
MNHFSFTQQRMEKYIVIQHMHTTKLRFPQAMSDTDRTNLFFFLPLHDDKLLNTIICSTNSLLKPHVSFSWALIVAVDRRSTSRTYWTRFFMKLASRGSVITTAARRRNRPYNIFLKFKILKLFKFKTFYTSNGIKNVIY